MSKDLQINYTLKATDLTGKDIDTAIANMERFYKAKDNLDRESEIKKKKIRDELTAKKQLEKQVINDKKSNDIHLKRYKQLLLKKSQMDRFSQLKALKGNEAALRTYIKESESRLLKLKSKIFSDNDYKGKYKNSLEELSLINMKSKAETMLGDVITSNNKQREKSIQSQKKLEEKVIQSQKKLEEKAIQSKIKLEEKNRLLAQKILEKQKIKDEKIRNNKLKMYKKLEQDKYKINQLVQLNKIKGNEKALKRYIRNSERELSKIRSGVLTQDNLLRELHLINMRNKAESMLGRIINSNNAKREKTLELQRRQRGANNIKAGAAAAGALYAGSRVMTYPFGQAMTLEQMGISMRAQYGVKAGNMVLEEMKKYSRDTAFTLKESTQLLLGVKIGAGNIGITNTRQQVDFVKEIGKAILAYGGNIEDRNEIGHQLSQIFMAGKANERQDLRVIQRRGLPIYTALQAMTGMDFEQLKNKYGAELPADLIAKAMIFMVRSPEVMRAWSERETSFVQSWESTTEQFGYTAGALGGRIAELLELPKKLRFATRALSDIENMLYDKKDGDSKVSFITYAASMFFMTSAVLALKGSFVALLWVIGKFGRTLSGAFGIASGLYLMMTDWSSLIENINKHGLSGFLKDLDKAVAILGVLGGGFAIGGFAGMAVAAIGLSAVGAYKLTIGEMKKYDEIKWQKLRKEFNTPILQTSRIPFSDPISSIVRDNKLEREQSFKPSLGILKAEVKVNNYFDSENREVKTETSVKNPLSAPVIYEHWDKQKYNFGY